MTYYWSAGTASCSVDFSRKLLRLFFSDGRGKCTVWRFARLGRVYAWRQLHHHPSKVRCLLFVWSPTGDEFRTSDTDFSISPVNRHRSLLLLFIWDGRGVWIIKKKTPSCTPAIYFHLTRPRTYSPYRSLRNRCTPTFTTGLLHTRSFFISVHSVHSTHTHTHPLVS